MIDGMAICRFYLELNLLMQIRDAALHYFEKKTSSEIREQADDSVRIKDLRHLLTSMGEKLTRDEMDELLKELPV